MNKKGYVSSKGWVVALVVIILLAIIGKACGGETDKDPSHYNFYTCNHCHGSGKTQSGAECKWCNGTGQYAVKKSGY